VNIFYYFILLHQILFYKFVVVNIFTFNFTVFSVNFSMEHKYTPQWKPTPCFCSLLLKSAVWMMLPDHMGANINSVNMVSSVSSLKFIPLSPSSALQLLQCHGFYVHPSYTADIYTSDQCSRKPPGVYHVFGRSSPAVVQWRQSDCVSFF